MAGYIGLLCAIGTQYIGGMAWALAAVVGYMAVTAPGIIRLVRLWRFNRACSGLQ